MIAAVKNLQISPLVVKKHGMCQKKASVRAPFSFSKTADASKRSRDCYIRSRVLPMYGHSRDSIAKETAKRYLIKGK